MLFFFIVGYP